MKAAHLLIAASLLSSTAWAAGQYFPRYGSASGGLVEFHKGGFYVHSNHTDEMSVYDCKKVGSMTPSIHWGQCQGGEKFLFTLDPKHPGTMKIGDVVYKECGKLWDKC